MTLPVKYFICYGDFHRSLSRNHNCFIDSTLAVKNAWIDRSHLFLLDYQRAMDHMHHCSVLHDSVDTI